MLNHTLKDGTLTLKISGHIDTDACQTLADDIKKVQSSVPHTALVVDCSEMSFISSTGLRIMIGLKKQEKNFKLTGVSNNVYNVFEMSGFTRIMTVEKAMRRIDLDKCEMLGAGGEGAVYRISPDELVKVNYRPDSREEIEEELKKAKEAFIMGIPTAISFDIADCGDGRLGVIYETIKSRSVGETAEDDPEHMAELMKKYVQLMKETNSIPGNLSIFGSIRQEWINMARKAGQHFTPEEAGIIVELAEALPEGDTMVHGDAHTKNAMIQNGEAMWIDMSMMGVGHPIFDLISATVILASPMESPVTKKMSGMSFANNQKAFPYFIQEYFHTTSAAQIEHITQLLRSVRVLRGLFTMGLDAPGIETYRPRLIEAARLAIFPAKDKMIENIKELTRLIDAL